MSKESLIRSFTAGRLRLSQMARRLLADSDDAEDALQDAFVRLWTHADALDIGSDADPLATAAVRNTCIDRLRHRSHSGVCYVDIDEASECCADDAGQVEEQRSRLEVVEQIIDTRLTPLQRRVLRLHDVEGRSYTEISHMEHISEQALRQHLSRARKAIRECFKDIHKRKP